MPGKSEAPALGPVAFLRFLWTQLTAMRTALTLLFVGALAAIPGSIIPQRPVSPLQVGQFITDNPTLGKVYDALGLFEVYTSPWFSAIYLLLLVSLVGCILPRLGVYAKAVRAQPVRTPKNLSRLPAYASAPASAQSSTEVLDRAEGELGRRRYRVRREGDSVSAERGYLREAGNLIFHISLVFVLVGVAIGVLFGYRGTSVVPVGGGFSNNLTQYDDLTSGAEFTDQDLDPFSVLIDEFDVSFETGPVNTGQPREFTARVTVIEAPGSQPRPDVITVNHPLEIEGAQIHLLGHGYSPIVTVRDGDGQVAWSGPVTFLPQDGNFTSAGVIKAPDARPERLAFEGIFVPTAPLDTAMPQSLFPDAFNPELYLNAWHGPPRTETGIPENVYSLNKTGLTQLTQPNGDLLRVRLKAGEVFDLPDNLGSVSYDGWQRWVKLQVSYTPGTIIIVVALLLGVIGLCLSLFIRPRRMWVRVRPETGAGVRTALTIEVAGLDRADARTGLDEEIVGLLTVLAGEDPDSVVGGQPEPAVDADRNDRSTVS